MTDLLKNPHQITILLSQLFFCILFFQSGIDKVIDWKGNLEWLKGHFANSPFRNCVPLLLGTITVLELLSGLTSAAGALGVFLPALAPIQVIGLLLAGTTLLMLFLGQRMAKDYPGAASLAIYFGVLLVSIGALASSKQ